MNEKLSIDFERRLYRLETAIRTYRETGKINDLFPLLYSVTSACWCKKPVVKSKS